MSRKDQFFDHTLNIMKKFPLKYREQEIHTFLKKKFYFPIQKTDSHQYIETFNKILPILYYYSHLYQHSEAKILKDLLIQFEQNISPDSGILELKNHLKLYLDDKNEHEKPSEREFRNEWIPSFISKIHKNNLTSQTMIYTPDYICHFMIRLVKWINSKNMGNQARFAWDEYIFYDPALGLYQFETALLNNLDQDSKNKEFIQRIIENQIYGHEIDAMSFMLGWIFFQLNLWKVIPNIKLSPQLKNQSALSTDFLQLLSNSKIINKPLIIIGNPPYSVSSINKGDWITALMGEYKVNEPNITRLYDDYVKFFRYAQWVLNQHHSGVLCFISNRKFLDGKIYYGMRKSLLNTFDRLYIIDLKGDQRNVKAKNPQENVFGIQTGVCISLFTKNVFKESHVKGQLFYTAITGTLGKIQQDLLMPIQNLIFKQIQPEAPKYLFIPINVSEKITLFWDKMTPLPEIFTHSSRAMISSRDNFMINVDKTELKWNLKQLKSRNYTKLRVKKRIRNKKDQILENEKIVSTFNLEKMEAQIIPINYRPLDIRYAINYTINKRCGSSAILEHLNEMILLTEEKDMKSILNDPKKSANIGFNFVQSVQKPPFNHIFITNGLVDSGLFGYSTSKVAPLWIDEKHNIAEQFLEKFKKVWRSATVGDCLGYLYGSLQNQWYSKTFEPFLLHHYPRVRVSSDLNLTKRISALGLELIKTHLNISNIVYLSHTYAPKKSKQPLQFLIKINYIENKEELQLVFKDAEINSRERINSSITLAKPIWNYKIGSIQVIKHWLKARKANKLHRQWNEQEWVQFDFIRQCCERTLSLQHKITKILNQEILM